MTNYTDIFNARGGSYVDAHTVAPNARQEEAAHLLNRLDLANATAVCDAPAGGGFIADEILKWRASHDDNAAQSAMAPITCVEPSAAFAERISAGHKKVQAPLTDCGLPDAIFDRIGSLAGLHHFEEKAPAFREMSRILAPAGLIAVADVRTDTPAAGFLNDSVDRYTETGHDGMFFADGEMTALMEDAGFTNITEHHILFHWRFPTEDIMVAFCQGLFGLTKATPDDTARELFKYFEIAKTDDGVALPWSLIYTAGTKP